MDATLLGQSPPYTYPNPTRYFIFNFCIISLIFITTPNQKKLGQYGKRK